MLSTCTTSSAPLSWCATSFSVFSDSSFFSFSVSRDTSRKALRFFSSSREALSSTDRSLAALRAACSSRRIKQNLKKNVLADVNNEKVKSLSVNETLELLQFGRDWSKRFDLPDCLRISFDDSSRPPPIRCGGKLRKKKKERLRSGLTWASVKVKRPPNPTPTSSARFRSCVNREVGPDSVTPCVMSRQMLPLLFPIGEFLVCSHMTVRPCLWSIPI